MRLYVNDYQVRYEIKLWPVKHPVPFIQPVEPWWLILVIGIHNGFGKGYKLPRFFIYLTKDCVEN